MAFAAITAVDEFWLTSPISDHPLSGEGHSRALLAIADLFFRVEQSISGLQARRATP